MSSEKIADPAPGRGRRMAIVAVVVVVFLALVLVGQLTMKSPSTPAAASPAATTATSTSTGSATSATGAHPQDSSIVRRDPSDAMAVGPVDAKVVLVMWTDTRCPFCASFHRDTLPKIVDEYVKTGKVRIETHDVAFFGQQSEDGSVAVRAAASQGRFSQYLDAMYGAAPANGHPDLPRAKLVGFAKTAGVPDIAKFTADLDSTQIRAAAQQSTTTAQGIGVTAVPFFVAGKTALSGAQSIEVFRQFLDQALAQAK